MVEPERWTAFTTDPTGGNPAGVVVTDERPDPDTMQRIAAEVGFSETAFLVPDGPGRWWTRYFAPAMEVPFCGHATIASAVALGSRDETLRDLVFDTAVGEVAVSLGRDGDGVVATLTSPAASVRPLAAESLHALLATFGWAADDLDPALPPAVGHSGGDHPVLALRDRSTLAAMRYPFEQLRELMHAEGWLTVQLVHREDERTFHARDPFPVGGVVEDPATGSAAAALGAYLREVGSLPEDGRFTVHQGVEMGRPSRLDVDASGTGGVRVTGAAVRLP